MIIISSKIERWYVLFLSSIGFSISICSNVCVCILQFISSQKKYASYTSMVCTTLKQWNDGRCVYFLAVSIQIILHQAFRVASEEHFLTAGSNYKKKICLVMLFAINSAVPEDYGAVIHYTWRREHTTYKKCVLALDGTNILSIPLYSAFFVLCASSLYS